MKRVLFLASQPFFQWRGSPIRLGFDVQAIHENGYDVDFLTLPIGERKDVPGVRIIRAPNVFFAKKISIGPSLMKFAFDGVMFLQALGLICRRHYAVVHGVEDCGLLALMLGRLGGGKVIFEKHSDSKSYKTSLVIKAYAAVERFVMRHADAVIGTGDGLTSQIKSLGPKGDVYSIFDIPSSLKEADPEATAKKRDEHKKHPDEILATYVGSFASYQGIDLLFEAIPIALDETPHLRFIIIGGTPQEIQARMEGLKEKRFQDQVTFPGKTPPDLLPNTLAASDILLSPRLSGGNTPLKFLDYLKAGRAILAADTEANRLLLNESTALLAPPTAQGYARGLVQLSQDKTLREKLSSQGRHLIDSTYNFTHFKSLLQKLYQKLFS